QSRPGTWVTLLRATRRIVVPWKGKSPMDLRMEFMARLNKGERMTDLCVEYGVSRKTGHKLKRRYGELGAAGLVDQSRAPKHIPHKTRPEIDENQAHESCELLFRTYGLPAVVRSDNGAPFASTGLAGLSKLSAYWMRHGIVPERIRPGNPQENGQHERMHRTLKRETTRP